MIVREGKPVTAEDIGSVQSDLIELSLLLEDSVMGIPAQDWVQGQGSQRRADDSDKEHVR